MPLHVRITDEVSSPRKDYDLDIMFPGAPISIKTLAKIAWGRAHDKGFESKPGVGVIDVIYQMRVIPPHEGDSLIIGDNSSTLIVYRLPITHVPKTETWELDI